MACLDQKSDGCDVLEAFRTKSPWQSMQNPASSFPIACASVTRRNGDVRTGITPRRTRSADVVRERDRHRERRHSTEMGEGSRRPDRGRGPGRPAARARAAAARRTLIAIDQREAPEYYRKALGITPRTQEIWDQCGILDDAQRRGRSSPAWKPRPTRDPSSASRFRRTASYGFRCRSTTPRRCWSAPRAAGLRVRQGVAGVLRPGSGRRDRGARGRPRQQAK